MQPRRLGCRLEHFIIFNPKLHDEHSKFELAFKNCASETSVAMVFLCEQKIHRL